MTATIIAFFMGASLSFSLTALYTVRQFNKMSYYACIAADAWKKTIEAQKKVNDANN